MKPGRLSFNKKFVLSAVLYLLASFFILFKHGIHVDGEAVKIIENANHLNAGTTFVNGIFGYFYFAYILLVALFLKISVNLFFVAILQIVLSFFAAICLYRILRGELNNERIAFAFFIVYLLCYPIQKWNYFLYTESIHTSMLMITLYYFNKLAAGRNVARFLVPVILLVFVLFSRPVGILFLASLVVVLLYWLYRNKKIKLFFLFFGLVVVGLVGFLNSPFTAFVNPDSIRRMEVVCQVPETNSTAEYQEYNRAGLYKAYLVIKDEVGFADFFITGFKKLAYFFGMYRSYYSWQHNLLLICFTAFYPLAVIGMFFRHAKRESYSRIFALCYLLLTSITIFFTCDEWSNRFISPAFPFVLILAAFGTWSISSSISAIQNKD